MMAGLGPHVPPRDDGGELVRCVRVRAGEPAQHVPEDLDPGDHWPGEQCDACGGAEYVLEPAGVRCSEEEHHDGTTRDGCGTLWPFMRLPARRVQF